MIVRNSEELLSHGNRIGREIVLDIIEHALKAVDAHEAMKKLTSISGENLTIGSFTFQLPEIGEIYVVGAGKATLPIAEVLEDVLGNRIREGFVIERKGSVYEHRLKRIEVIEAGHPIPDENGLKGAKRIVELAKNAKEGDLVFCILTGGCSALMPLPADGISLEDKRKATDLLLKSGATIGEMNAVRKHISAIKGGRLAKYIYPAEIVTLTLVTSPAETSWPWPDPVLPDPSTFSDAVSVLERYELWKEVPESVRKHLREGLEDSSLETPKEEDLRDVKVHIISLANRETLCEAAKKRAEELGFKSAILATMMEGESREAGVVLAGVAREIERCRRPLEPPCVLISGGETTVTIRGEHGEGGPNQEFALGFSLKIAGSKRILVAAMDTDGSDGPTGVAGGIADGYTVERAIERGLDIFKSLRRHDSLFLLSELKDAIITGITRTHVQNLRLVVVLSNSFSC